MFFDYKFFIFVLRKERIREDKMNQKTPVCTSGRTCHTGKNYHFDIGAVSDMLECKSSIIDALCALWGSSLRLTSEFRGRLIP